MKKWFTGLKNAETFLSAEERKLYRNYKLYYADLVIKAGDQAYTDDGRETIIAQAERAFPGGESLMKKVSAEANRFVAASGNKN